jgi:hypothetical protein
MATCLNHLFTISELLKLDEKQLAILDAAILREIQTSPQIRELLRTKMKSALYDGFVAQNASAKKKASPKKKK